MRQLAPVWHGLHLFDHGATREVLCESRLAGTCGAKKKYDILLSECVGFFLDLLIEDQEVLKVEWLDNFNALVQFFDNFIMEAFVLVLLNCVINGCGHICVFDLGFFQLESFLKKANRRGDSFINVCAFEQLIFFIKLGETQIVKDTKDCSFEANREVFI